MEWFEVYGDSIANDGIYEREMLVTDLTNIKVNEFTALLGYLECKRVKNRIKKRKLLMERYASNLNSSKCYTPVFQKNNY